MHRLFLRSAIAAACALPAWAAHTQTVASSNPEGRVIVRFKADTTQARIASASDRMQVLARSAGLGLVGRGHISEDTQVVTASGLSSTELAQRLAALPNVAAVEVDQKMRIRALPNDPKYSSDQWYLQGTQPAAINAQSAWDQTTGSASVIVAVIDTGVRSDHEELSGKLLPGYDFVSCDSAVSCATANDGDGRDADPSDPGDWYYTTNSQNQQVPVPSSWHGTRVSSLIAANTNNAAGIAGVSWASRILPVRALGVEGGYISDVVAAMRWAAGLNVPGITDNPTPANIINMSLGGNGSCSASYQSAVNEVIARGVLIVAAAGNDSNAVDQPGNCSGVLAVAGVRHVGTKVGYSSFGAEVGIAAPAGNCVNVVDGQTCLYPITSAVNLGSTGPAANGYTSSTNPNAPYGTSFAAPQAAGVAALMLAVNPAIPPAKLIERIKASARSFPTETGLPTCPLTDANGQCNCTTSTCGAGLLNAPGAVTQALRPVASLAYSGTNAVGFTLSLSGSGSSAISGASISSYQWSVSGTGATLSNASAPTASLALSASGIVNLTLTVTDSNGRSDSTTQAITVWADQQSAASSSSSSGGTSSTSSSSGGGGGSLGLLGLLCALGLAGAMRRYVQA